MHAVILAGGKGTRLRPLTVYTPKPIVSLVNRPFLEYQIEILKKAGVDKITLSLNYQPDKIEQIMGDGSAYDIELKYITEPSPMGTGGAYRYAANGIEDTTIVLNGDILTGMDIGKAVAFHKEKGASATLSLMPVDDPSRYGLVETNDNSEILRFLEKPAHSDVEKLAVYTINAGIYILEPSIMDLMPLGENRSFEYEIFPQILEKKIPFYGYVMKGEYWRDIGTPSSYLEAHHDLLNGRLSAFRPKNDHRPETTAEIDDLSVIGGDSVIKAGSKISNSVIGKGVVIDEKCVIENSVIWQHARISAGCELRNAIVGRSCLVGRNCILSAGTVLGDKSTLTDHTKV